MTKLTLGTKLKNEYGTWTVVEITNYHGDIWYDIYNPDSGVTILFPSNIKYYTIID
jgi:hypothetical protein